MSLLNPSTELTLEQKQAQAKDQVLQAAAMNYKQLCRMQKEGIRAVWKNPKLTPQQACDALGTEAARLFQLHGILTAAIVSIATADGTPPDIDLPTHAFTVNQNGTVTVLTTPYVP